MTKCRKSVWSTMGDYGFQFTVAIWHKIYKMAVGKIPPTDGTLQFMVDFFKL